MSKYFNANLTFQSEIGSKMIDNEFKFDNTEFFADSKFVEYKVLLRKKLASYQKTTGNICTKETIENIQERVLWTLASNQKQNCFHLSSKS